MSRYEFYVPPLRRWPALWWANYRMLYRKVVKPMIDPWTSLRRDPPWAD